MKHEIELKVYDDKAYGFSQYFCINIYKADCDGIITQHREIRCAPFVVRTEHVKHKYLQLKLGFFNWYTAIEFGKFDE